MFRACQLQVLPELLVVAAEPSVPGHEPGMVSRGGRAGDVRGRRAAGLAQFPSDVGKVPAEGRVGQAGPPRDCQDAGTLAGRCGFGEDAVPGLAGLFGGGLLSGAAHGSHPGCGGPGSL